LKRNRTEQYEQEIASGDFSAYSPAELEKASKYFDTEPATGAELRLDDIQTPEKPNVDESNRAHDERMQANPWFKLSHLSGKNR